MHETVHHLAMPAGFSQLDEFGQAPAFCWQLARVVKGLDLKSTGPGPRWVKSSSCRGGVYATRLDWKGRIHELEGLRNVGGVIA